MRCLPVWSSSRLGEAIWIACRHSLIAEARHSRRAGHADRADGADPARATGSRGQRRRRCRDRPGRRRAARGGGGIRTARAGRSRCPGPSLRRARGRRPRTTAWPRRRPPGRKRRGAAPGDRPRGGPRQETPRRAAAQETLWLDGRPVDPRARAASVLRDGALVATDPRAAAATSLAEPAWPRCAWSAGPRRGRCTGSGFGTLTLGASPDCQVRVTGTGLPAYAARLVIGPAARPGRPSSSRCASPPTASRCC